MLDASTLRWPPLARYALANFTWHNDATTVTPCCRDDSCFCTPWMPFNGCIIPSPLLPYTTSQSCAECVWIGQCVQTRPNIRQRCLFRSPTTRIWNTLQLLIDTTSTHYLLCMTMCIILLSSALSQCNLSHVIHFVKSWCIAGARWNKSVLHTWHFEK